MKELIKIGYCLIMGIILMACKKNKEIVDENPMLLPEYAKEAVAYAGYNRIKVVFLAADEQIAYHRIYWNKRKESLKIDRKKNPGDTISTIITDLTEGEQKIEIVSYNADGDSTAVVVTGRSYGEKYVSTLKNREIKNMTFIGGEDPYVDWATAAKGEVFTKITYLDADGEKKELKADKESIFTSLPGYQEDTAIEYTSMYIPEPGSIDTLNRVIEVIPRLTKEVPESTYTRYVGPLTIGTGDGRSAVNAADFLNDDFWKEIQSLLADGSVTVKFTVGNYSRAFSEKSFILDKMGHAQNRLLLTGSGTGTVFTAVMGAGNKTVMMLIRDSQNIVVRNFNFTGDGNIQYVLRILGTVGRPGLAKNIVIENCKWFDMRGVVFGATGAHYTAERVTYRNCQFHRIGINHASHLIYNAYGAKHVRIINSHFEDCTGDFVRFRDNCDFGLVNNCTFIRNANFPTNANFRFISIPLFNDVNPGDEHFATNYSFTSNRFTNANYVYTFYHDGYSPAGFNHLLNAEEGKTLETGTTAAKKLLLKTNLGIDPDKVRLHGNQYTNVGGRIIFGSATAYGSVSRGWVGSVNITNLFNENNATPFSWEN